ncbi:MAG: ROK family protein [Ilumatobacteraceae bacterium]
MSDCFLSIDVGNSKLSAAVVDQHGEILIRDRVPTPARDVWPTLSRLVKRVMAAAPTQPIGCGVGVSGPIDSTAGTISPLHMPSLVDVPLQAMVEELTEMPTVVDHSAKAVALGEAWRGAAVGESNFVTVVLGSAVTGGIVIGGKLLSGRLGNAGAIGHVIVEVGGRPCACGAHGCLEAYCGGAALEAETGRPPQRAPQAIVERTGILVGRALASVGAVCDLRLGVIGGAVALGFGDAFFSAVQQEVDQRAKLSFTSEFRVVPSRLGLIAPLVGAAALARHAVGAAR